MTRERFEELAAAYGGNLARWPAAWREQAALLAAAEPEFARAVLAGEDGLDALLDQAPRTTGSPELFDRIVAGAPAARRRRGWPAWLLPAGLSAGLAAAGAAGVLLGAQLGGGAGGSAESGAGAAVAALDVSTVAGDV